MRDAFLHAHARCTTPSASCRQPCCRQPQRGSALHIALCAAPQVSSIGYIGGDKNISITQQLAAVVEQHLSIPPTRVYVNVRLATGTKGTASRTPCGQRCPVHHAPGQQPHIRHMLTCQHVSVARSLAPDILMILLPMRAVLRHPVCGLGHTRWGCSDLHAGHAVPLTALHLYLLSDSVPTHMLSMLQAPRMLH
jgi:Macrophage migration inhibitory factor (MIF)